MQVAFFTDSYLPTRDGTATVVDLLARALVRKGDRVRIFAPRSDAGPTVRTEEGGLEVVRVRSHAVPLYHVYRSPYALSLARALRGTGGTRDADVVHVHTPGLVGTGGFFSARRSRRPIVGTFHTDLAAMESSVRSKLGVPSFFRVAGWYSLGLYWRCDRATAPTAVTRDAMLAAATKPFRTPISVVPNGIDVEEFRPERRVPDWRQRCGLSNDPLVTFLGRLTVDKGVHRFLDGVRETLERRSIVAIVAGRGPEEGAVRDRLTADPVLARHVRYVGPVVEEEKAALFAQSEIFVLASTSDTSSVVLLEAMACGAAVIGPAEGGPAEIVDDGITGLRVPVRTPGALAAAIGRLVDDDAERRALGARALAFVRTSASVDAMAQRYDAIYAELCTARPRGRVVV